MTRPRHLEWEGCFNARDLGGLPTLDGRETRWGAVVRSDGLDHLTSAGWDAVEAHGIRTIIDLRNDDERTGIGSRPSWLSTLHLPLDNIEDAEFWREWNSDWQCGTALYYRPHIERFPKRSADVIRAIASAPSGGVAVHCVGGRDRTGMITMLLLRLVGVAFEDISADYLLSRDRLHPLYERLGVADQGPLIEAFLRERDTSLAEVVETTLASLDLEAWQCEGGLRKSDVAALKARLVD